MIADEKSGNPSGAAVAGKRRQGDANIVAEESGLVLADAGQCRPQREAFQLGGSARGADPASAFAQRLAERTQEENKESPGKPNHKENHLPRPGGADKRQLDNLLGGSQLDDQPAQKKGHARADVNGHGVHTDGGGALLSGEGIRDQGVGRGGKRRLAHTHTHAQQKKLPELLRQAASGRQQAPGDHSGGNESAAAS